jgi:hypothetical protein
VQQSTAGVDPGAGARALWSSLGIPNVVRSYDVPLQYGKQEITRGKNEQQAFSDAVTKGQLDEAAAWPGLASAVGIIRNLQAAGVWPRGGVTNAVQRGQLIRGLEQAQVQQGALSRQVAAQGTG